MSLTITPVYAGLLGLWLVVLSIRIILYRRQNSISLGHKDDPLLERRIRGHGNFVEYTPIALILLGLFELQEGSAVVVHLFGGILTAGRLMHGYALSFKTYSPLRVPGMALTLVAIMGLSLANILIPFV